jgi:hypothetical protein
MSDVNDWYRKQQEEQKARSKNRPVKQKATGTFWRGRPILDANGDDTGKVRPIRKGEIETAKMVAEAQALAEASHNIFSNPPGIQTQGVENLPGYSPPGDHCE